MKKIWYNTAITLFLFLFATVSFAVPAAVETNDVLFEPTDLKVVDDKVELMGSYTELTYTISNDEVTIIDCATSATYVEIPSIIEGYPVVTVGSSAFADCIKLEEVLLGDNLKIIEKKHFIIVKT